jgi:hypothetical protein
MYVNEILIFPTNGIERTGASIAEDLNGQAVYSIQQGTGLLPAQA